MAKSSIVRFSTNAENRVFLFLVGYLVLVFLTGGGARADIQSLMILRPMSVLFCGLALWTLTRPQLKSQKFLILSFTAIFALVAIHLIPLPPAVWGTLPGRDIIVEVDETIGLGPTWRPLSLVPSATWNALFSLSVPLAVLLLGVQLSREQRFQLLPILLTIGLASGLLGVLQVIGDPKGSLYLYRITNNGSAVGLFSNRNHQAVLLATMFPMLAAYASTGARTAEQSRFRGWIAAAAAGALVPLLMVTGSRAGLLVGALGLAAAARLYSKPSIKTIQKRKANKFDWRIPVAAFGALCLASLSVIMSRAEALQRLAAPDQLEELRFQVWGPIAAMAWKYFPVGSGIGSFPEVYQIDEPRQLLSQTYLNHAHNDWLELWLTAGLPGMLILGCVMFLFGAKILRVLSSPLEKTRDVLFARLGAIILVIFAFSSIGDYPLRTPSLSCTFIVACLWLCAPVERRAKNAGGL